MALPITYTFSEYVLPEIIRRWSIDNDPDARAVTSGPSLVAWVDALGDPPTQGQLDPVFDAFEVQRVRCEAIYAGLAPIFLGLNQAKRAFLEVMRAKVVQDLNFPLYDAAAARVVVEESIDVIPQKWEEVRTEMLAVFDANP